MYLIGTVDGWMDGAIEDRQMTFRQIYVIQKA